MASSGEIQQRGCLPPFSPLRRTSARFKGAAPSSAVFVLTQGGSAAGRAPPFSKPADTMWGEWAKLTGVFLYHRPFERRFCGMHKARCFKGHREKAARAIPYSLGERWGLCGDYKTCNTRQMSHTKRPHTSLDLCGRLCGAARKPQCVVMQALRLPQNPWVIAARSTGSSKAQVNTTQKR